MSTSRHFGRLLAATFAIGCVLWGACSQGDSTDKDASPSTSQTLTGPTSSSTPSTSAQTFGIIDLKDPVVLRANSEEGWEMLKSQDGDESCLAFRFRSGAGTSSCGGSLFDFKLMIIGGSGLRSVDDERTFLYGVAADRVKTIRLEGVGLEAVEVVLTTVRVGPQQVGTFVLKNAPPFDTAIALDGDGHEVDRNADFRPYSP